jgi:two-component system, sensor histidine kinase and response regulator
MTDIHPVSKGTVLIVDDTPQNLELLEGILMHQGYEVRSSPNGPLALRSLNIALPEVILLDIRMPDMNGYQMCERIKADDRTRGIPVIFISALGEEEDKVRGFEVGGVDYITKPFHAGEVLARIETHLTIHRLQQGLHAEVIRRTQAEEELRILNQLLAEANASKDTFFSIIAHDLRSPFTGLLGLTEAIIEDFARYTPEKLMLLLRRIHDSAEQTYALLNNLLMWSRLERGLMECERQTFSLSDMVERIFRLFTVHAERKQIALHTHVPPGMTVYADQMMMDTILRNLLSNALKFTDVDGTVSVSAHPNVDGMVEIRVTDTGMGMNQKTMQTLFRIEHKQSRRGTAGETGTGLGLILCKELVEKNGGTIGVESEVGKGTTFWLTIPMFPLEEWHL